jgi:hypothetical protein
MAVGLVISDKSSGKKAKSSDPKHSYFPDNYNILICISVFYDFVRFPEAITADFDEINPLTQS